ncbi:hypothetical protein D3C87_1753930 [compost metagenome]
MMKPSASKSLIASRTGVMLVPIIWASSACLSLEPRGKRPEMIPSRRKSATNSSFVRCFTPKPFVMECQPGLTPRMVHNAISYHGAVPPVLGDKSTRKTRPCILSGAVG